MKEFDTKVSVRINLVPTSEMVENARESVAKALEITREHALESRLDSGTPIENRSQK